MILCQCLPVLQHHEEEQEEIPEFELILNSQIGRNERLFFSKFGFLRLMQKCIQMNEIPVDSLKTL